MQAAEEGTRAHAVAERLLKGKDVKCADAEMKSGAEFYVDYVKARKKFLGSKLYIEKKVNLSKYIPEGFGTCDALLVKKDVLEIIDFKYGKYCRVDAYFNSQLLIYALGALCACQEKYKNLKKVIMTIFQPRMDNISIFTIKPNELLHWGENVLKPGALAAWEGEGEPRAGSHCLFCLYKPHCEAFKNIKGSKEKFEKIPDDEDI